MLPQATLSTGYVMNGGTAGAHPGAVLIGRPEEAAIRTCPNRIAISP